MTCRDIERLVREGRSARERIHEQTFRGWVNKNLLVSGDDLHISNLFGGLRDGVMVVKLAENLTMEALNAKVRLNPTMEVVIVNQRGRK
jgi:hypothetical protein